MIKLPRLSRLIAKNIKNASTSFKLRFLTQFSTISRLQMLSECGNGRGTLWNREKRERGCLDSSIGLKSQLGCLQRRRTSLFKGFLIVTVQSLRSTVTMKHPRWIVLENVAIVGSEMEGPDASLEMRYKWHAISLLGSRSNG